MNVRVRYAPSPTGLQHIGGLRTALFNYLFAKTTNGKFFLRIEDTDQSRYSADAEADLYNTLKWAGLDWDEGPDMGGSFGPYVQSQRLDLYKKYAEELIEKDLAYPCFCTPQRMDDLRKSQETNKLPLGYDRHCRSLSLEDRKQLHSSGAKFTIRFKVPSEGSTVVPDGILGSIETANKELAADPVLLKTDGFPTYHLAHVVDDHLMETSHVLRAQEWLPSAPLHILLFKAFGWQAPEYFHLPLILGKDKQKLSKRHGATSVKQFMDDGYLPEAVVNYLALLGWSFNDEKEFFSLPELCEVFDLKRINKSPAVFDYEKLNHFNAHYLRQKTDHELVALFIPELVKAQCLIGENDPKAGEYLLQCVPLIKERVKFAKEVPGIAGFLFKDVTNWQLEEVIPKKLDKDTTIKILSKAMELLNEFDNQPDEKNEEEFHQAAEEMGVKLGDFMMPIRVAVSGSKVSPPMFPSIKILGSSIVKTRLEGAINFLKNS